ncbi:MAG: hypothetical protein R3E95_12245 [Thiolinea sp.]
MLLDRGVDFAMGHVVFCDGVVVDGTLVVKLLNLLTVWFRHGLDGSCIPVKVLIIDVVRVDGK